MGNIQIKQQPRKRQSIFGKRQSQYQRSHSKSKSKSPFKQAIRTNSPYYKRISPIKYSPINQSQRKNELTDRSLNEFSFERSEQKYFRAKNKIQQSSNNRLQQLSQNKYKCEEIIRKVKNFNQFLTELKRRLKQNCIINKSQQKRPKKQISMSVKLQNQKIQLQKYKKLVQRQLSKTHSIQSIMIQNSNNGQKILTIQYEQQTNQQQPSTYPISLQYNKSTKNNQNNFKQNIVNQNKLKQAKKLLQMLKLRCNQLGTLLDHQQNISLKRQSTRNNMLTTTQAQINAKSLLITLEQTKKQSKQIQNKISSLLI